MTLSVQLYTMLAMIGAGSWFGAALDTYQRFLQRGSRKKWIVFVHDVLFWLVHGLLFFYLLFLVNYGELRFYLLLALLCGFAAYQALFKTFYLRLLEWLIRFLQACIRLVRQMVRMLIFRPAAAIVMLLFSLLTGIWKALLAVVKIAANMLLWIIKIILKPVSWILGLFWGMLPKTATNYVARKLAALAGTIDWSKNKLREGCSFIRRFFQKKQ